MHERIHSDLVFFCLINEMMDKATRQAPHAWRRGWGAGGVSGRGARPTAARATTVTTPCSGQGSSRKKKNIYIRMLKRKKSNDISDFFIAGYIYGVLHGGV